MIFSGAANDPVTPSLDPKVTDYVMGPMGTLARFSNDAVTYLHPDHLGSAQAGTTASGSLAWQEQYTPFGETLQSPTANNNLDGFTGHIKDSATGLSGIRSRRLAICTNARTLRRIWARR